MPQAPIRDYFARWVDEIQSFRPQRALAVAHMLVSAIPSAKSRIETPSIGRRKLDL
jgi:hypothetical protein